MHPDAPLTHDGHHARPAGDGATRTPRPSAQPRRNELRLTLFEPAAATLDGGPLRFRRRSAVALLAYLGVTGRASTRVQLAALLADDPGYGTALLRNSLLELRALLGAQLRIVGQRVALDPALARLSAGAPGVAYSPTGSVPASRP